MSSILSGDKSRCRGFGSVGKWWILWLCWGNEVSGRVEWPGCLAIHDFVCGVFISCFWTSFWNRKPKKKPRSLRICVPWLRKSPNAQFYLEVKPFSSLVLHFYLCK